MFSRFRVFAHLVEEILLQGTLLLVKFGGRFFQILFVLAYNLLLHLSHKQFLLLYNPFAFLVEGEFNVLELPLSVLGVPLKLVVNSRHKNIEVVLDRHALVMGSDVVVGDQFVLVVQGNLQFYF